jgi:recombination protein RecT
MAEHTTIVKTEDPVYKMLTSYKKAIASVLPKHLTAERMLRLAYTMIHRNRKLRECSPVSLINGIIEISMLGLDIGRTAHLVPFKGEAVMIPDYKGYIDLAYRSDRVNSFPFKPVYEGDEFDYQEGTERFIRHKPARENRGQLVAAYAIVNYKNGGFDFEVVLPPDIEATKRKSPGAKYKDSPWNDPDNEWTMWCKTAVRRLAKRVPQSPELQRAAFLEELAESGLKQNIGHIAGEAMEAEFTATSVPEKSTEGTKEAVQKKLDALSASGQTESEDEKFLCPHCGFEAQSERGLKKHITQSHSNLGSESTTPAPDDDDGSSFPPPPNSAPPEKENGSEEAYFHCEHLGQRKAVRYCLEKCYLAEKCQQHEEVVRENS